jgi:hypothetical protein
VSANDKKLSSKDKVIGRASGRIPPDWNLVYKLQMIAASGFVHRKRGGPNDRYAAGLKL